MSYSGDDTIAAIATPPGQGGVGVVRLSGSHCREVLARMFRPSARATGEFLPRHLHHGHVLDAHGRVLDEGLAVFFPAPRSFTGEDVAELHCHGGGAILRAVLETVLATGLVRPASAGEFSRRAFLHGKLDLTQAEAVAEAIAAPTTAAAQLAQDRLSGALSRRIDSLRLILESLKRDCCLAVDFPEDEVECLPPDAFQAQVAEVREAVAGLAAQHRRTRVWREGALVVLAGRVNAGKSSLLNALLGRQRAIVSEVPGTTRDYLEESLLLAGMAVRLVDTAGLRDQGEIVPGGLDGAEAQGIARSRELMDGADLVLLVVDARSDAAAQPHSPERALLARLHDRALVVLNKMDVAAASALAAFPDAVPVSAATGQGLDSLATIMADRLAAAAPEPRPGELTPNLRQTMLLEQADAELAALAAEHAAGMPCDILTVRLDAAVALLAELTGAITSAAILDQIFSSFCIGK
ncbi:tRNA uridine-5-carboxymethylaminomethyl(34) synthesis GTPase MnmE [Megalodesulfovibrio gigas]|uniref:tRNA modification GTPase MnmE n=1 Tax=Megalodesulfovibrio gigas (strain ATCC 19364 / DSM 1382 / NCIMB 9332 / VKM B-1759) TaxID=1121448 RepID=T2GEK0_MEGG1|nr:tRNA uridine-5-carboxymethylaminomethyl(34) synthesis GTPase MnmE [Megalodesulfovibrio gigas]AGW14708.1 putative tRNA modification GTPase TrmE [Megalodesulfovibrio gigas DSM 1382 = ATCC 19364]